MRYIPNSQADRQQMLAEIGIDSTEQLFAGIPEKLRLRRLLDLPKALSESELLEYFRKRASKNEIEPAAVIGAGIYRHYIPIVIDALIRSEEHTSELQSLAYLVCRLLLEKKKKSKLHSLRR